MSEEGELLRRARTLDQAALGEVFDCYYEPLYRYIYHHVRHQGTAEDLAAEVFTRMLSQLARGRGPRRHLRAWLYRVAHNLVIDESRRQVHRDHEPLNPFQPAADEGPESAVESADLAEEIRGALDELPPKQRAVIVLRYLAGLENAETAQVLRTSVGAVKALQHRAMVSIRRRFAQGLRTAEELT